MSQKFNNPWDERYSAPGYYYGIEPNDWLKLQVSAFAPHARILTLGEGEGRNAVYLAQMGFEVTAVDASRVGLSKLKKLAQEKGVQVKTIQADLNDFDLAENDWDGIISIWCHLPVPLRRKVHQGVVHSLKQNGVFLLEAYHPRQLQYKTGGPAQIELLMRLEDLRVELKGLEWVVAQEVDRDVREGQGHFGKSAVVQVLARKSV